MNTYTAFFVWGWSSGALVMLGACTIWDAVQRRNAAQKWAETNRRWPLH